MRNKAEILKSIFNRERIYAFARIYAYFFTFFLTLKLINFVPEKYFGELLAASIMLGLWYAHLLRYVKQDSKKFSDIIKQFISSGFCQKFPLRGITCRILLYLIGMVPLLVIIPIVNLFFGEFSGLARIWFITYLVVLAAVIFLSSDEEQKEQER